MKISHIIYQAAIILALVSAAAITMLYAFANHVFRTISDQGTLYKFGSGFYFDLGPAIQRAALAAAKKGKESVASPKITSKSKRVVVEEVAPESEENHSSEEAESPPPRAAKSKASTKKASTAATKSRARKNK
ncbi:putative transmembrane protein [Gregarina niphandrodes]|uniref:Transmembrane protein n=1 Tax=Gregarina niphandrodes TaxID=110365 RepID=A0A023BBU7_GRENI|nr:putative transmembrane protein [Gregarina niphandrodes]EZG81076.1 putative transmembrane protein [Gregarina niphandrodes]|eukprot:XP_011134272.1 putative transmembrane protein [Gregarina niphandrodes]